ncbi:MAG: bifunctional diaminohydroxyphosphoribosylaminopyrimidine deaminase/5-amino-6-(5-phosphoribosylamino)uracil reductase RibD [Candidatus Omnitrophota bacterium]
MKNCEAERYMRLALDLARKGEGRTHPNPMVGAVIVSGKKVIARGYHHKAGSDHAEIMAMKSSKGPLKNAVMFVTLEPCDHYGKTPPCTSSIIESGIKKVYVAIKDPNPINSGRGIRKLLKNGIAVDVGICRKEAAYLNRAYIKFITKGLSYVTVKLAQSIDGKLAARDGTSKWISSAESRQLVKKMRAYSDAVMVGINTVLKDDPALLAAKRPGKKPARIVLDSRLRIPENSRLVKTADIVPLIIVTTPDVSSKKSVRLARKSGVEIVIAKSSGGKVDLEDLLKKMGEKGIVKIFSEGGGTLAGALIEGGFADDVVFFIAPKILGGNKFSIGGKGVPGIKDAIVIERAEISTCGGDVVVRGNLRGEGQRGKG